MSEMRTVDIHTHLYPPAFVSLLERRSCLPLIRRVPGSDILRLVILPGEDDPSKPIEQRGRPVGPDYWDIDQKINFMNKHGIDMSIISLANPWLDFVPHDQASSIARTVNQDLSSLCAKHPKRLFAFGTLPLSASQASVVDEILSLKSMPSMRGVIMGTSGLGKGLDDPDLDMVYKALEETATVVFLHPHYGLPNDVYGPRSTEFGHVLPLALGFPLETTIAVTRMILSGVWDRFPRLQVLLAHSGGTLPFLAGRIESCIAHDASLKQAGRLEKRRSLRDILSSNIFLDAVIYDRIGLVSAIEASGADRLLFGEVRSEWHHGSNL